MFLLDALGALGVQNHALLALATLDASVWTLELPVLHVSAGLWASTDAWRVASTAVALHWAESVASPVDVHTESVTLGSVGGDGCTEASAIGTAVASASVKHAVLEVLLWIDVLVAWREHAGVVGDDGASLGGPWLSVSVGIAWINN